MPNDSRRLTRLAREYAARLELEQRQAAFQRERDVQQPVWRQLSPNTPPTTASWSQASQDYLTSTFGVINDNASLTTNPISIPPPQPSEEQEIMTYTELWNRFLLYNHPQPSTSGALEIIRINEKVSILKHAGINRVIGIKAIHQGIVFILYARDMRLDSVFGNWRSSVRTERIRAEVQVRVEYMTNNNRLAQARGAHFYGNALHSLSEIQTRLTHAFNGVNWTDIFNSEVITNERLIGSIRTFDGEPLTNEDGQPIAATPMECCSGCNRMVRRRFMLTSGIPKLDDEGNVLENEQGEPIEDERRVCQVCVERGNGTHLTQDQMHVHAPVVSKMDTTFSRWPFSRSSGVELEAAVVAPIKQDRLRAIGWKMVHDGSISGFKANWKALEFNSPPAAGDAFYDAIVNGMKLWAKNSRVNKSCGFHVHVDWTDLDRAQKANCQNFLIAMDSLMFALQPGSRSTNSYCRRYPKGHKPSTPQNIFMSEKYMGVNFSHCETPQTTGQVRAGGSSAYGTIEFRMAAGTRNVDKVLKWVEFCQRLVEIGGEFKFDDQCLGLRDRSNHQKLSLFIELARKCDTIHNRPPTFLEALLPWLEERFKKFQGEQARVETITYSYKAKPDYSGATPLPVEPLAETYEERLGYA